MVDPFTRYSAVAYGPGLVARPLQPAGEWFHAPRFLWDLLAFLPFLAVVTLDVWGSGSVRLPRSLPAAVVRGVGATAKRALPYLPLLLGWSDVLLATLGARGLALFSALAAASVPLPGQPGSEPDPRVPAIGWWLAGAVMAVSAARSIGTARHWLLFPAAAGALAWVARPLASQVAIPSYFAVAGLMVAGHVFSRCQQVACLLTHAALGAILALALSLRWTDAMLGAPASDTAGYFNTAREFWARVPAEHTNPIALAYLNAHPAAREPLFIVLMSGVFAVMGPTLVHQREVTVLASVACVWITYAFGRRTLGVLTGLLAALLLALEPWHVLVSQEGLREEVAMVLVYGLALLALSRHLKSLPRQLVAGVLAGSAMLTRLDAGVVVAFLLLVIAVRLRKAWLRSAPAWATCGVMVVPLLIGNRLRAGEALAQLGSSMGGDIQEAMTPLLRGDVRAGAVVQYLFAGTVQVYRVTIFGGYGAYLGQVLGDVFAGLASFCFATGFVLALAHRRWVLAILCVLGVVIPPFDYLAGIGVVGGPGGGYTDRYTYTVLPATLATASSCVVRIGQATLRWSVGIVQSARHGRPATE